MKHYVMSEAVFTTRVLVRVLCLTSIQAKFVIIFMGLICRFFQVIFSSLSYNFKFFNSRFLLLRTNKILTSFLKWLMLLSLPEDRKRPASETQNFIQQDRQYTWNVTLRRSFNHCCSGKAISFKHPEFVFVALSIQQAMGMRHIVFYDLPCSKLYFHIIS